MIKGDPRNPGQMRVLHNLYMKRTYIDINVITSYDNLALAAVKARKGKQFRKDAMAFFSDIDANLAQLRKDILSSRAPYGRYTKFTIHDPKKREIHAACFRDRIIHHALMNQMDHVFERALLPTVFACRKGKGTLKAVLYVQQCIRRYPWYVKIDIAKYFDSIDHEILLSLLYRKFKGKEILHIINRIINSYHVVPGKGLPIGSLTSQYFANYYLGVFDRFIVEQLKASAYTRYMDDMIWWYADKESCKQSIKTVTGFLQSTCKLHIKKAPQINKSVKGISFCGFRIYPGILRLSRRRKKRYIKLRAKWEDIFSSGIMTPLQLQTAYDAVHSITAHAASREWRRKIGNSMPVIDV